MGSDIGESALLFSVLEAQADTQFMVGGGWERSIQYRLRSVPPEDGDVPRPRDTPVIDAVLRIEYFDGLEPNPNWGLMVIDEAIEGEGVMLFFALEAPLEAVEAQIRDAAVAPPRAVAVFHPPLGPDVRRRAAKRIPVMPEPTPFSRVLLTTSLAEARSATMRRPAAP